MDRVFLARPRLRGGRDLPAHRRAWPGPRRRVEDGGRPPHHRDRHRTLRVAAERPDLRRPHVPAVDGRRRPAPATPSPRSRRSAGSRRRSLARSPCWDCPTSASACRRPPATPSPACSSTSAWRPASARRSSTPPRSLPLNRLPIEQRDVCLDLVWDRRRPDYDPLPSCSRCSPTSSRRRPRSPTAAAPRQTSASSCASSTAIGEFTVDLDAAMAGGMPALDIVNTVLLEDEGGRRAVRLRADAAAVRAAVGGDDEDGGRLPRAAHGPRRPARRRRASSSSAR